jgi:L-threonylcarbamoyladenylate synthase
MLIDQAKATQILNSGGNVIIPTETVYGLAGSIYHPHAIAEIYRLKNRPRSNPLIIHGSSVDQVLCLIKNPPESFFLLAEKFWPGPLTLILEAAPHTLSHLSTVAIRIPNHKETLALIEKTGPLAAPSANLSGKPSSTRLSHLEKDFGKDFPVLEGKEPRYGLESTVLGWIEGSWQILRYGCITQEMIEAVLGKEVSTSNLPISPGKNFKHYSPDATLLSLPEDLLSAQAVIGYENRSYRSLLPFYSLGLDSDPETIASRLFAILRKIDEDGLQKVWIDKNLPQHGLYITILERIERAGKTSL